MLATGLRFATAELANEFGGGRLISGVVRWVVDPAQFGVRRCNTSGLAIRMGVPFNQATTASTVSA